MGFVKDALENLSAIEMKTGLGARQLLALLMSR
jgi:hypothetical protein